MAATGALTQDSRPDDPTVTTRPGSWGHTGTEVSPGIRTGGMAPPDEALSTGALPTDRLTARGRPVPEIRAEFRQIQNLRNAGNVLLVWLQTFGVIAAAMVIDRPIGWVMAFIGMGRGHGLLAILSHEASHRLLFSRKSVNDFVGKWFVAYPTLLPLDLYRRGHMAHHREEFGPTEPDMGFYGNYPIPPSSLKRKLRRDLTFVTGWKNLRVLLKAVAGPSRKVAIQILAVQAAIWLTFAALGFWWVYPVIWLAPWMTIWKAQNRLRAIAEHGGMEASDDLRRTTHHARQSVLARAYFVPYNTGWHLAHHVDPGIPFQHLPALHDELVEAGWVTPSIEYRSYLQLWKALASAPE